MKLLRRLLGRPRVPASGVAFVGITPAGDWVIRYRRADADPVETCPRVPGTPTFTRLAEADAYLRGLTGEGPAFEYPASGPV